MTVWLENGLQALRLKETLGEAGFTPKEISITVPPSLTKTVLGMSSSSFKLSSGMTTTQSEDQGPCYLIVQTLTDLDEALAKAVFRDCGVTLENTEVQLVPGSLEGLENSFNSRVMRR